ncbi:MAG: CHAP domain-containing protein [Microvirga sp.]|nr:CHAP domain-containing protein [Microvirga sp.]
MLLRKGSTGQAVRELSEALLALGRVGVATDVFDARLDRTVRAFQTQNLDPRGEPLVVDGIVGPLTRFAIDAALGARDALAVVDEDEPLSPFGDVALSVAREEAARGAGEAAGNNRGADIRAYLDGRATEGSDWCAGFVSWCHREGARRLGRAMPFRYSLGARDIRNQFRERGWDYSPSAAHPPRPGDIVVWWRGAVSGWQGHIGLVERCVDGILTTIEGNRGPFPSRVSRYRYVLGRMERLLGFGRVRA